MQKFLGAALTFFAIALGGTDDSAAAPKVVATILPIHGLVADVMVGIGQPTLLLPPGVSEHMAALKPSDAKVLSGADVVVWIGEGIETLLAKPIKALAKKTAIVTLSRDAGITLLNNRTGGLWEDHDEVPKSGKHAHAHHDTNLHIWLDPENAAKVVRHVAAILARIDTANASRYADNAEAAVQRLNALDTELRAALAPIKGVPFVVFHDAFPYLELRYGLNAIGSIVVSPEQKPGSKRVLEIRKKFEVSGAVCVFTEPQYNPNLVRSLVAGTNVRIGVLDPIGSEISAGPGAYEILMRKLAATARTCLTSAPP